MRLSDMYSDELVISTNEYMFHKNMITYVTISTQVPSNLHTTSNSNLMGKSLKKI